MTQELYYTSSPRGLLPGKSGFCTVAATRQMGAVLMERLESLSSYRPLFPPHHPQASLNPLTLVHLRISVGGHNYSLLSRIGSAGLDYTGRTNVSAHHVVLELAEQPAGGPAWLLQQKAFRLDGAWQGEPRYLEPRTPPRGDIVPGPCREWQRVMGDAGWGGVLAERFEKEPSHVVYLIFEPGFDPLPLLAESLMLLPPERRWEVAFSTYYTGLPPGVPCVWRCVANGSEEAKKAAKMPGTISLCVPAGPASGGDRVEQARTGLARRKTLAAAAQLPSLPVPPSIASPEKMVELETVPLSERSRSRIWPFLTGILAGMILMACASGVMGVMGYFFAVQPLVEAEGKRKKQESTLKDELQDKDKKIKELSNEAASMQALNVSLAVTLENERQSRGVLENERQSRDVQVKEKMKQVLSGKKLRGKPLDVEWKQDETTEEMGKKFIEKADAVAQEICEEQGGKMNMIIKEIQKTMVDLGNDRTKKAIDDALKSTPGKDKKAEISDAFINWYVNLCTFNGSQTLEVWLKCEKDFEMISENKKKLNEKGFKQYCDKLKNDYSKVGNIGQKYHKLVELRKAAIDNNLHPPQDKK